MKTSSTYLVTDNGAAGDDLTNNTTILQETVDQCASNGGGTVVVPAGIFRTGTLVLRDHVTLHLEAGAELRAIESLDAFPDTKPPVTCNYDFMFRHALLYAAGARNIAVTGFGTVNCRGAAEAFARRSKEPPERYMYRPSIVRFVDCTRVRIENVTLRDSAFWSVHLLACSDVVVHGITLLSRSPNYNNDGLDIDACEDVRISDCNIDSDDDAISIKGTTAHPCRRVLVTNCTLSSNCNAIRVGAENFSAFEDIQFTNLHIRDSGTAISFQNIDGYPMRNIRFQQITMRGVGVPIYIVTNRKTYPVGVPEAEYPVPHGPAPSAIEGIVIDGLRGEAIGEYRGTEAVNHLVEYTRRVPVVISGHPRAPIRNLELRNIHLTFTEAPSEENPIDAIEDVNEYPNPIPWTYPVSGIYIRNAVGVRMENITVRTAEGDTRPTVGLEGVARAQVLGLEIPASSHSPVEAFDTTITDWERVRQLNDEGVLTDVRSASDRTADWRQSTR